MGWSKDTLNAAGAAVDGLASAKAPSNREAVMRLKGKLMNAKARGVSYEQMADALGQVGIAISAERLRKYLAEVSKGTPKTDAAKGGVGKSMVSMGLTHFLIESGEKVFLIDADTSNPDVFKSYKDEVDSEIVNLDDADGWVRFVDICDEHKNSTVVVNTAARNNVGVAAYGATLSRSLEELERELVTLWVINRQRDSLELLSDYMDAIPNSTVHVAKNGYFGRDIKFELYNNSNVKKAVEAKNGLSVLFPDMADRVSDDLYSNRLRARPEIG